MDVRGIKKSICLSKDHNVLRDIGLFELEQHDGSDPNVPYWTVLYGIVYDVSDWTSVHPGGSRMIRLISGRDGTQFLESYHHFNAVHKVSSVIINRLSRNIIGRFKPNDTDKQHTIITKSLKCGNDAFYDTLCERVDRYLKRSNISYHGYSPFFNHMDCILTFALYLITAVGTWFHTAYYTEYLWAILHGIICARCGFLQHTASHRAYKSILMNEFVAGFSDILGMDHNMWLLKHVVFHHIAPNILGIDPDVMASQPWTRFHPTLPLKWYHKYQCVYIPFSGAFFSFSWILTEIVIGMRLLLHKLNIISGKFVLEYGYGFHVNWNTFSIANWIFGKTWFFSIHLLLRLLCVSKDGSWIIGVVLVAYFTLGTVLIGTFSMNHLHAELFADVNENDNDNMHWSVLQVFNSANWSSRSRFWCWMSGGLNHQIEHHLFPSMHHQNYALISPIVEETCKEFDIPYRDQGNVIRCLIKVEKYLYDMGRPRMRED
eukprot:666024_1